MNKRVAHVASIAIIAFALLLTPAALAAKGRGGGKPSGGSTSGSNICLAPSSSTRTATAYRTMPTS